MIGMISDIGNDFAERQLWAVRVGRIEAVGQDCGDAAKVWIESRVLDSARHANDLNPLHKAVVRPFSAPI